MCACVTVREYRTDDLDALFALDYVCFTDVYRFNRQAMRRFAEARGAIALVAVDQDDALAGFVIAQVEGAAKQRYGYVVTLDIAPHWRRCRLASRLMAEVERRVKEKGVGTMALHVSIVNEAAWRFYEKTGYERVAMETDFYAEGLDAFVYAKPLGGL